MHISLSMMASFSTLKAGRDLAARRIINPQRRIGYLSVPSKRVETLPPVLWRCLHADGRAFSILKAGRDLAAIFKAYHQKSIISFSTLKAGRDLAAKEHAP